MLGFMLRHVGAGSPALHRLRLAANLVVTGGKAVERGLLSHCLTTGSMAERLGLGPDVCGPLQQVFTRWDGKGVPGDIGGEDIALSDAAVPSRRHGRGLPPRRRSGRCRRGRASASGQALRSRRRGRVLPCGSRRARRPVGAARLATRSSTLSRRCSDASPKPSSTAPSRRSPTSPTCGRASRAGHSRGSRRARRARRDGQSDCPEPMSQLFAAPRWCTTSACTACRPRSSTSPARCRRRSPSGCGCTPTTPSGCWPAQPRWPESARSPSLTHERCDGSGYHRGLTRPGDPGHRPAARRRVRVSRHDRTPRPTARP